MFEGEETAGLVPTLFSEQVEAALEAINNDPIKAHYDVGKANRLLFIPECLSLSEAVSIIKKLR